MHGKHPRNGNALFLSAGQLVGRVFAELVHSHRFQALLHPLPDLFRGYAHVFGSKTHILLHDLTDDLIVRILEHHARRLSDIPDFTFILRILAVHPDASLGGTQDGVHVLGKRGLSGTVVSQNRDKIALCNIYGHLVHRTVDSLHVSVLVPSDIFIYKLVCLNDTHILHSLSFPLPPRTRYCEPRRGKCLRAYYCTKIPCKIQQICSTVLQTCKIMLHC